MTASCLPTAIAVVGALKNIWSEGKGDLEWITLSSAPDDEYHPRHIVAEVLKCDGFSASVICADQNYAYIATNMFGKNETYTLVITDNNCLVAVFSDRDFAAGTKEINP